MCFSAAASFTMGGALALAGIASVGKVNEVSKLPFACIPFIFSFQQFTEGFTWLSLSGNPHYSQWQNVFIYTFLFFAQVLWPAWVPFSILLFEKDPGRKKILKLLLITGIIVSSYLAYCLFNFDASAKIDGKHIRYELSFPYKVTMLSGLFYFLPTTVSPFVSGIRGMKWIGAGIFISYLISQVFFKDYLISVWCFLAAGISAVIFWIMAQSNKELIIPETELKKM